MLVNITEWAMDSYFELVIDKKVISKAEYKAILRPNVELLKKEQSLPLQGPEFSNSKFWSPATSQGATISCGFKMKWHNFGNGKFQLRLCVAIINSECFLCRAYVKDHKSEKREMANFKIHVRRILNNNFVMRGQL